MTRLLARSLLALGLCLLPQRGVAHELGTTRVSATFNADLSYAVEVVTDAQALVEKLETLADVPAEALTPTDAAASRLEDRLRALQEVWRSRVGLSFQGEPSRPDLTIRVTPAADAGGPALAVVTLSGLRPPDARQFTWQYGWTFASYALIVRTSPTGAPAVQWLEGGVVSAPQPVVASPPASWMDTAGRYLRLGFTHILPLGLDHVLFVLGLFLLNSRLRPLLMQVSAFTVAHSITLALSMVGLVSVPASIVEPLIAVSIAYVALENLFLAELTTWRVALVFGCGLLHGLGFAGVLSELGLPRGEFTTALLSFNIGVEAAQLSVVGAAALLVGAQASRAWYRERVVIPASTLIACVAIYWTIERMA